MTSLSGRYVLFALAVACLNKKNLNMEELFDGDQYRYGFLVAVASMGIFKGESDYDGVSVDELRCLSSVGVAITAPARSISTLPRG